MTIIILKIRESYENFQNPVDSSMVNEVLEFQEGNNQNLEIHNSFAKFKLNRVLPSNYFLQIIIKTRLNAL